MKTNQYIQVQFTIDDRALAEEIAGKLIEEKLAACIQIIGPIASIYRWQGKIEKSDEWLCLVKTEKSRYHSLEMRIKELHPYEVPEIISVDITDIEPNYANWILNTLELQ